MKSIKVLSALSLLALASAAHAEVSGSAAIASSYLWRGFDLGAGHGVPAVSGDLHASAAGFYAGIWGSSGDYTNGTEYDLYAGYGGSAGAFTYDISYWTYAYPANKDSGGNPGNLSEAVVSLGVGPVSVFFNENLNMYGTENDGDYQYYGVKGKFGAFTLLAAHHDDEGMKLTHADLSYAYNDNLAFTVSKPVTVAEGYDRPAPTFVVSYTVPFGK